MIIDIGELPPTYTIYEIEGSIPPANAPHRGPVDVERAKAALEPGAPAYNGPYYDEFKENDLMWHRGGPDERLNLYRFEARKGWVLASNDVIHTSTVKFVVEMQMDDSAKLRYVSKLVPATPPL